MATKLIDIAAEGRQLIDRYELVAEIASGGMATVYLARLSGVGGFQRFVAIKRLHPHLASEKEFVEMFLDEARLAAGIHHPNVVPILEVGASQRGYYIVMEYVEGDTLARLLARAASGGKRLPLPIGTRVMVDTLGGLHAAHELRDADGTPTGLVHRDVSPQNILVGSDGICRITDFGVARAATRLTATRVGQLKGKVAYMAPEQAMGQEDVDRRADVFAAGIVLWEVLAGRRLFKAVNEAATLSRVISGDIVTPRDLNPDVDERVAAVCLKALDREPDNRFASSAEFADALERAAAAAGALATGRDVSTYVGEVIGEEIESQRAAVRAWLAQSEVSRVEEPGVSSVSSVSAVAMDHVGPPSTTVVTPSAVDQTGTVAGPARRRASLVPWLAASVLLLLGAGAYFTSPLLLDRPGPAPQVPASPVTSSTAAATHDGTKDDDAGGGTTAASAEGDIVDPSSLPVVPDEEPATAAPRPGPVAPRPVVPPAPRPPAPKPTPKPTPKPAGPDLSNPYR